MGQEIERKFLVSGTGPWTTGRSSGGASGGEPGGAGGVGSSVAEGTELVQGYLCTDPERTVRVRLAGPQAFLTVKGRSKGLSRVECEWPIPVDDARQLLALCLPPLIEKRRYVVPFAGKRWEIDVFAGVNAGLVLAEVELESEDEPVSLPPWVGEEVSHDRRYQNSNLVASPWSEWGAGGSDPTG